MTIKQQGGIFGRNPTFNNVEADGNLTVSGQTTFNSNITIQNDTAPKISIFDSNGGFAAATFTSENGGRDLAIFAPQDIIFDQNGLETARFLLGGGLTFNGDTAAANALDDYEEGTWTPVYNSAGTVSYDIQDGYYRKIGSVVVAGFTISASSMSATGTNTIEIGGLPFASNSDASSLAQRGTFEAIFFTVDGTTSYDLAIAGASSTALQIRKMSNGGGNVASTYSEMTSQTSCQIRGMITYIV